MDIKRSLLDVLYLLPDSMLAIVALKTSVSGTERSDHFGGEKVFSGKTVHTVYLVFLLFIFIMLVGEHPMNSEHFTVHSGR